MVLVKCLNKKNKDLGKFIEEYIINRKNISIIILILDIRHDPTSDDKLMYDFLLNNNLPFFIVANKADKIAKTKIGTFIEPVLKPLGFDWRIGIGLVAGGAAKEVFVSTIAQIKSIEDGDETVLTESLQNDPVFNPIVAYTLLLFVLLYFPCFAAIGVIGAEIGNKWIPFLMIYTLAVAWIVSFAFYQIAGRIAGII